MGIYETSGLFIDSNFSNWTKYGTTGHVFYVETDESEGNNLVQDERLWEKT